MLHANLPCEEGVKTAVSEAKEKGTRAIKVVIDKNKLVMGGSVPAGPSLKDDWASIVGLLGDEAPCIVLVYLTDEQGTLKEVAQVGTGEADWGLLTWVPEASPARQKMLYASSKQSLKMVFKDLTFWPVSHTEKAEVTLQSLLQKTYMTEEERHARMTNDEIAVDRAKQEVEAERKAAPKMLPGMAAIRIKTQPSFDEALAEVLASEGAAVVASLAGATSEELCGELVGGVATPAQLRGKLPADDIRFVVLGLAGGVLLFFTWLPETAPIKMRMRCSSFKASVRQLLREKAESRMVVQAEVTEDADLTDDLGKAKDEAPGGVPEAAAQAGSSESNAEPKKFKPPPGAVAMIGMAK